MLTKVHPRLWHVVIALILDDLDDLPDEFTKAPKFARYLVKEWKRVADVVYTVDTPVRTNNLAEIFNRYIVERLGGVHPNIWIFLSTYKLSTMTQYSRKIYQLPDLNGKLL